MTHPYTLYSSTTRHHRKVVGQDAPEQTQTQHGHRRAGSDQGQELAGTGELIYKVAPGDVLHVLGAGDEKETKPHASEVGDSEGAEGVT